MYDPIDTPSYVSAEALSTSERMRLGVIRPFHNPAYLAATMGGDGAIAPWSETSGNYTFPCPLCSRTATAKRASRQAAITLACERHCDPDRLKEVCQRRAPMAFTHRNDLIVPMPPAAVEAIRARLTDGSMDANAVSALGGPGARVILSALDKLRAGAVSTALYTVTNPEGDVVAAVARADRMSDGIASKVFCQFHCEGSLSEANELRIGLFDPLWPLVGLHELAKNPAKPVLVVEGEKARAAASELLPGYLCVTSLCGAGNPHFSDWSSLCGRDVYVLGDNDDAGTDFAHHVAAQAIAARAGTVKIVQPPSGAPPGWDLAEALPSGLSADDVANLVTSAPTVTWDQVKSAMKRKSAGQEWPPFRMPDGHLSNNQPIVEGIEQALKHIDSGCGRASWLKVLGSIYHALGDAGLDLAIAWSRQDEAKHGKFHEGEVELLFAAFGAAPHATPMLVKNLFWRAHNESKERSNSGEGWRPDADARAEAEIAAFASEHRKLVQGDNVYIALQKRQPDGRYLVDRKSERTATSIYKSKRVLDHDGKKMSSVYKLWEVHSSTRPLEVVFRPGESVADDQYNSFSGFAVRAVAGGSYALFRAHITRVCRENEDDAEWLWNCMAYRLQYPGRRMGSAVCFVGPQGSGKTRIVEVIAKLTGPHSLRLSDPEQFVGKFNGSLEAKLFVACDEMTLGHKPEWCDKLNNYITEDIIGLQEKNLAQVQADNKMWIGMTANRPDVVRINKGERRYAMYRVSDPFLGDEGKRSVHYGAMMAELEAGGYEALMHDLMHHQIPTDFNPKAVPQTPLLKELVGVSVDRDPLPRWWQDVLERGTIASTDRLPSRWTAPVAKDTVYSQYVSWCDTDGSASRRRVLSKAEWAKAFGRLLPDGLSAKRITVDGARVHVLALPEYSECCDHFEAIRGIELDRAPSAHQIPSAM